ncbi:DUF3048 domain-containing protein [Nocardioides scoriae]|nr:DUF3048 domain-containing protein [Nocardioides scoriae]
MTRPTRPRALAASLLAAGLLATAACAGGGGDAPTATGTPDSQPIQGGTTLAALWPLTGRKVTTATPDRPVLVAKIDNSSSSEPQVGLSSADLVTEELVEGGETRLAAFFYQRVPPVVGPVRSMRATDIGIVMPAHATIVASGAAPPTLLRLKQNGISFYDEETDPGYYRDSARRMPYNLMVRLPELIRSIDDDPVVPPSYLPWGSRSGFTGASKARTVDAVFSDEHTTSWRYEKGRYVNDNSHAAEGDRFVPDNLLVLRVEVGDAGYLDPAGNPVPETIYQGKGDALLFHGGELVRGTWSKLSRATPLKLRTAAGRLEVPAGRTWIELVPRDADGGRVDVG